MRYLLDSNTCIRFLNQRSPAIIDRLTNTPDEDVFVCSVVKAEMFYGSERSARQARTVSAREVLLKLRAMRQQ